MFDEKTLLTRLQNGEDVQSIAEELTTMLNSVNKTYLEEQAEKKRKAEEEKKKLAEEAKIAESQKKKELQDILDLFYEWFNTYYTLSDEVKELCGEMDAEFFIEAIKMGEEYAKSLKTLDALFDFKPIKEFKIKPTKEDPLDSFIKSMGW